MKKSKHPLDEIKREVFQFDADLARLKLALLKENFEYRAFYEKFIQSIDDLNFSIPAYDFEKFGLPGVVFIFGAPWQDDVLDLLDPYREVDFDSKKEDSLLSKIFYYHAVWQVELNTPFEGLASRTFEYIERKGLKPYERLFVVDLRKKKKQILRELSEHINSAYRFSDFYETETWKPDKSRLREEAWKHLKVWKLRRKRLSFSKIAEELGSTEDNVKKSFYRAYELTQFSKYDPDMLKKEVWLIKKSELQKTCDVCEDRESCMVLCPEILNFVNQDLTHSKEKILPEDSESLKDYLFHKPTD